MGRLARGPSHFDRDFSCSTNELRVAQDHLHNFHAKRDKVTRKKT